jgi:hypothetical protein
LVWTWCQCGVPQGLKWQGCQRPFCPGPVQGTLLPVVLLPSPTLSITCHNALTRLRSCGPLPHCCRCCARNSVRLPIVARHNSESARTATSNAHYQPQCDGSDRLPLRRMVGYRRAGPRVDHICGARAREQFVRRTPILGRCLVAAVSLCTTGVWASQLHLTLRLRLDLFACHCPQSGTGLRFGKAGKAGRVAVVLCIVRINSFALHWSFARCALHLALST